MAADAGHSGGSVAAAVACAGKRGSLCGASQFTHDGMEQINL